MCGKYHGPIALPMGKETSTFIIKDWVDSRACLNMFVVGRMPPFFQNRNTVTQYLANYFTVWAIQNSITNAPVLLVAPANHQSLMNIIIYFIFYVMHCVAYKL
jgi:hypothetical protein